MADLRKVIKKVRRITEIDVRDTSMDWLVDIRADQASREAWEADKKIKRQHNFEAMQRANEIRKAEREAEALRQEEINRQRMVNLKKARRALKKKRSNT